MFFRAVTFIGAYIKFTLEKLFCKLFAIPPSNNLDNHSLVNFGHAVHYKIDHLPTQFMICLFPSLIMTVSGLIVYAGGVVPLVYLGVKPSDAFSGAVSYPTYVIYIVLTVIGGMFLSNVLPSFTDIKTLYELIYVADEVHPVLKIFAFVPCMAAYVFSFLERTGITALALAAFPVVMIYLQR